MTVPAPVVAVADPLSAHARMARGRIALTLSVPLLNVTDALPAQHTRFHGMSEQAVLGGAIRDTNGRHDCDSPRSHDGGVAIAAVVRLYGARFISAKGFDCALKVYARIMGGSAIEYDRVYGKVARGAAQINCGVRCVNRGVAAGLYSQPGLVTASGIVCIIDVMVTPSAVIVMGALAAVGPVVLAALTALTPGEPAGMVTLTPG